MREEVAVTARQMNANYAGPMKIIAFEEHFSRGSGFLRYTLDERVFDGVGRAVEAKMRVEKIHANDTTRAYCHCWLRISAARWC